MRLIEQIAAAVPRFEPAEIELFNRKFQVKVLVCTMADYKRRMKRFQGEESAIAAEMAEWFFTEDGEQAFAPEDFEKLPASAVKKLMDLFSRINTGVEVKNA